MDVNNDVDIAFDTPVSVKLAELESYTIINEMGGWLLLNDVEVVIKGDMGIHFDVVIFVVNDNLDVPYG
jgi:hypothetical protein